MRIQKGIFYIPVHRYLFLFLFALLALLFLGIVGSVFKRLFPILGPIGTLVLLITCLLGSYINIPLKRIKTQASYFKSKSVTFLGMTYPIPTIETKSYTTIIAINLGGAIIPTIASLYLLYNTPSIIFNAALATAFVVIIVKLFARPVRGLGITIPNFIPPIAAALPSILIGGTSGPIVAYVSGTLGTLIGADLLNLQIMSNLDSPLVSIGGAGTFDGIFLAGIIAAIIAF